MEETQKSGKRIYNFALVLLFLFIPIIILYMWGNNYSLDAPIDNSKFGTFGDFVGGVLGSIWSLCGVLLFYSALKEQREDFKTNKNALLKQVDALEIQSKEFTLQRRELTESRKVFVEQSKTLMQQRLESTYFSLLEIYEKVVSNLNLQSKNNNYFKVFKNELFRDIPHDCSPYDSHRLAHERYLEVFYNKKEELSHYFKLIYRIIKIIDDAEIEDGEKFRYIKILRSQLSENEMLAIYYNSHSVYGGESYKLILKYNLLKHLPCTSKVELAQFLWKINASGRIVIPINSGNTLLELNKKSSFLLRFNNETIRILHNFLSVINQEIRKETFNGLKVSYNLPLYSDIIIALYSMENYELTIEISSRHIDLNEIAKLEKQTFINYFKAYLYDSFIFSRYIEMEEENPPFSIKLSEEARKIKFEITSTKKLTLNLDIE